MFTDVQRKMIKNGVRNLEIFGYSGKVTEENILTHPFFSKYFKKELENCLGEGYDKDIKGLLSIIEKRSKTA
ncbi:hypothetical protein AT268_32580 [Bacillus cereus]|uniref:Uncharacterized protein n=1 Tax=Bacillus cereus TaxID=1396 RepID=A0A9X0SPG9_BACCE|nr:MULTISPECIES: hypothetical protein [Bacillus cereus group]KXY51229.1 hypothetical protein AT268_32580 [Bacillus cereus]PES55166.1 hypothetical protein CN515_03670 [Bacillus cereus]PEZ75379.1 hypothetical protein CN410_15055 [Bacillus anthracis]PFA29567.1 hypothetical protein CN384_07695 [Bacillus thuringiensis]